MSSSDLERVRSDLSTMRNALGIGLLWSGTDVWFCAAISAAGGLHAALSWPNAPWEVTSAWAAAPLAATLGVYMIYIALKSRRLSPREEPRRREYRSTLVALACLIPAAGVYGRWGKYVGMTKMQLVGSAMALMGIALLVVGVAQPPARYPRSYLIVGALPAIAFGLAIPIVQAPYYHSLIGLLGLVGLGLAAFVMHRHVRRLQSAEGGEHVGG
ncbi:MAG TPA: hypothetical protein VNH11_23930 [Pirellulales bacterium]|nr:hypothetical protein [Pirellulales bacterium]